MDDPNMMVEQHMKGFKNLNLKDKNIKEKTVMASGYIIFEKL